MLTRMLLLNASNKGLKYTKTPPFNTFAMLYRQSTAKYGTRFSRSEKQTSGSSKKVPHIRHNVAPRVMVVPARPTSAKDPFAFFLLI
jgi:hypothetical protein